MKTAASKKRNALIILLFLLIAAIGLFWYLNHKTTVPTTQFIIHAQQDTSLVLNDHAVLVIPKCAFGDKSQLIHLQVDLQEEAIDFMQQNLSTITSDGKLLESGGMLHLTAQTSAGTAIEIATDCPLFLRLGSRYALNNAAHYHGVEKDDRIFWEKAAELEHWLTPVPLKDLNFYLEGHPKPQHPVAATPRAMPTQDTGSDTTTTPYCGLDEKIVDQLYQASFERTLISTKEFEQRMHCIHKSCSEDLLNLYLDNLEKNLYEIDALAYDFLRKGNFSAALAEAFLNFSQLGCTKVKDANAIPKEVITYLQKFAKEEQAKRYWYYTTRISQTGWHNIDALYKNPNLLEVVGEFALSSSQTLDWKTAKIFALGKKENSSIELQWDADKTRFCFNDYVKYANEREAYIFATLRDGTHYYAGFVVVSFSKPVGERTIKMISSSVEKIDSMLKQFRPADVGVFDQAADCCYTESDGWHS